MTAAAVKKEVDCIIGQGACDNLGRFQLQEGSKDEISEMTVYFCPGVLRVKLYLGNIS